MKQTQKQQILQSLKKGETVTPIDALNKFHCFRLGARIYDLKQDGWNIKSNMKNGFANYRLIGS